MKIFFVVFAVFISSSIFAQTSRESEIEVWTSFQLNWKINKNWKIKVKNQERFVYNQSPLKLVFFQGEIQRKFYKHHSFFIRYRYTFDQLDEHNLNRLSVGYKFNYKVNKKIDLSSRIVYQYEQRVYTLEPLSTIRNKYTINIDLKKKKNVFFDYELFVKQNEYWQLSTHRFTIGATKEFKKKIEFDMYYRADISVNRKTNTNQHILGLGLRYTI